MAINLEGLKWAIDNLTETVTYTDEQGVETTINVSNKIEPSAQFKLTGAKFEEPIPRAYLNYILNQIYLAIQNLDSRIP